MARHISTTLSSRVICTLRLILLIPVRVLGLSLSFVCCIATRQHPGCVSLRGSGACIARSALLAASPLAIVCPFSGSDLVWTEHALDIRLRVTRAAHLPNLALTVCRHSCRLSRDERVFLLHYFVFLTLDFEDGPESSSTLVLSLKRANSKYIITTDIKWQF